MAASSCPIPPCPIFVINLEHDGVRRAHMTEQCARLGLAVEFVPAVNGRALSEADRAVYDRARALRVYGVEMLDTEIGCYLSHYRLYERMVRENIPAALIMEDDVELSPALPRIVEDLLADPAPEWQVVRLESLRPRVREPKTPKFRGRTVQTLRDGELVRLGTHVLGFGAYLIRLDGARRMLDYGRRIFMPVDQTMDRYWDNGIAPYLVRPIPVRQRTDMDSRIGARPAGRHEGQPLAIQLARRWQRLSDSVRKRLYRG
ncbi:glycosyl transferase family 25 [Nitrospirillum viridazoti]|uniref:glycosyltransferase family 25 protein n=1 Tax=Nitrospirillum viridazoti TaxID=3144925 RepID=UPI000AE9FCDF|nr:glycosyltransferase family 25 protein [Nitrospirillum amazonense]TWB38784.1 glycosyl transferase family 25 [Nitrospirillum amazonense]